MQQPQIFISYRRDDAAGYARAVNDELVRCFGAERVFIDVDDINAGQPFSEVIQRSVGDSAVLLALIGKRWRGERDGAAPRIFEADDFVRQEVAAGLAKGLRVIPVLLDGVADARRGAPAAGPGRPGRAQRARARQHALRGRHGAPGARSARRARRRQRRRQRPTRAASRTGWWIAAAVVVAAAAIAALWQSQRSPAPVTPSRVEQRRPCRRSARKSTANGRPTSPTTGTTPASRERFIFAGEARRAARQRLVPRRRARRARGPLDAAGVSFVTRTSESSGSGDSGAAVVHRYRGRLAGEELRFVMQTEGGSSAHVPVEFVARRVASQASQAGR